MRAHALAETAGEINSRVSLTIRPSRKVMIRLANLATSSECVTTMMVMPCARLSSLENSHDLGAGTRIELPGRFVGQQNFRFVDERASDRYALLLSAGKLRRQTVLPSRQTDQSQHALGPLVGISGIAALVQQGQLHVFHGAHARQRLKF